MVQNQQMIHLLREKKRQMKTGGQAAAAVEATLVQSSDEKRTERSEVSVEIEYNKEDHDITLTPAEERMASLPENSKLRRAVDKPNAWPVLQCGRVFVLPGVPVFFEEKLEMICENFFDKEPDISLRRVNLGVDEISIVEALNTVVKKYPEINFGSYPFFEEDAKVRTTVTIEGQSESAVLAALSDFLDLIEDEHVLYVDSKDELRAG